MNKIKILGKEYIIKKYNSDIDGQAIGQSDSIKGEIKIAQDVSKDRMNETMLHEIVHIFNYDIAINLNEKQITQIASCIYSVFSDNGIKINFKL